MPKVSIIIPVYNTEKYLRELLESVRNQTFRDFEAIIVNDGSTDGSQSVIDYYCSLDERFSFLLQKNSGVSAARNAGLDKARGEYVTFYDSDDVVPENALEDLHRIAKEHNSDLVVGGRSNINYSIETVHKQSMKLAAKNEISKFDGDFAYSFSLCNKLFKRAIIAANNIRFYEDDAVEDGLFVFRFLAVCEKINGCNEVVYGYKKRSFLAADQSLSQTADKKKLMRILQDIDSIKEIYDEYIRKSDVYNKEQLREDFVQDLLFRTINVQLLNQFFRQIWIIGDEAVELAKAEFNRLYGQLNDDKKNTLRNRHFDIDIDSPLKTKEEIAKKPETAIIVTDNVSNQNINTVIKSIYSQLSPYFAVYVSSRKEEFIQDHYKDKENFYFIDAAKPRQMLSEIMKQSGAEYYMLINEDIVLDKTTLVVLLKHLRKHKKFDMATAPVYTLDTDNMTSEKHESYRKMYGNKVIKRAALEKYFNRKAYIKMDYDFLNKKLKIKNKDTTEVFILMPGKGRS